jgi:hypothetical protein
VKGKKDTPIWVHLDNEKEIAKEAKILKLKEGTIRARRRL